MPQKPRMSSEEAWASLEQLRDVTRSAPAYDPAPPRWITELHEILEAIAVSEAQALYRLDGMTGVNMRYLHNRVLDVLRDFDRLVEEQHLK